MRHWRGLRRPPGGRGRSGLPRRARPRSRPRSRAVRRWPVAARPAGPTRHAAAAPR